MNISLVTFPRYVMSFFLPKENSVSPVAEKISPKLCIAEIERELKGLEQEYMITSFSCSATFRTEAMNALSVKRSSLYAEVWSLLSYAAAGAFIWKAQSYAHGYRAFFSGFACNKGWIGAVGSLSYWAEAVVDADRFSKTGHCFTIGGGYKIRFNTQWGEYQVSHDEIGANIESFKNFTEALVYCCKG